MRKLSVIMATYNEDLNFLSACIDSILRQTFQDFDFIIVIEPDEKNNVFLEKVADADKRVIVLENESRLGLSGSRNRAIKKSSSEYIAFIDSDDYCDIRRFERQIKFLSNNPEASVVGSNMHLVNEYNDIIGERNYPEQYEDIKRQFLLTMAIANPTVMIKKDDFQEVGLFNENLSKAEDFELWLRFLANKKKIYNLQEKLVYYRVPTTHNERRGNIHWRNNYLARKRFSKLIWPLSKRIFSLGFYFLISHIPDEFLNSNPNLKVINRIKKININ